jgi:UDP-3-O-[3-hydroxymyristoyl] glucosamine N-acyltransferase
MNKNFFKIRNKIKVIELLGILDVNEEEFLNVNVKIDNINNLFVDDFVSFSNLKKDKLSFLTSKINNFSKVSSGVCIVQHEHLNLLNEQIIKIPFKYPKKGFSIILEKYFAKFHLKNKPYTVHPTAFVHKTAKIGNNVFVGAYSFIDEGVVIEDDTFISERVSVSYNCIIGKECFVGVGTVLECSIIGNKVTISANTVVGKTGFGFIPNRSKTHITPHIGGVFIAEGTNIGAGCTIDRGLIDDTYIGKYVMIDNQVHIGHNSVIDDFCILAGQVGLSGSVTLKKNVIIGGDVSIKDNITIGEDSVIAGASKVFNSFPKGSYIGGSPAQDINAWKRMVAQQRLNLKKRKNNENGS